MAKFKVGDKVKLLEGLIIDQCYGGVSYLGSMEKLRAYEPLTIREVDDDEDEEYNCCYIVEEDPIHLYLSEAMLESVAEVEEATDREKFERWMRDLSSLDVYSKVWNALEDVVSTEPDEDGYEEKLKIVSDYLFGAEKKKKKMTKAEIETELGYEIEIVEE